MMTANMEAFQQGSLSQLHFVGKEYRYLIKTSTITPDLNDFQYDCLLQFD